jgi:sulfur relay (sulfurtransferase) DsrF/TusC family protein
MDETLENLINIKSIDKAQAQTFINEQPFTWNKNRNENQLDQWDRQIHVKVLKRFQDHLCKNNS